MPLVSQNHALYLYQLIQRTIGEGCQVSLANIEAVLAEDNLAAADFDCDDVLSLMQAVPAFIKVTTFKKGRVFVTLMPYPEFDQALEALNQDSPAEKGADKLKPWRRKRRTKLLRPQKPKQKKPEAAPEVAVEVADEAAEEKIVEGQAAPEDEKIAAEVEQVTTEDKQAATPDEQVVSAEGVQTVPAEEQNLEAAEPEQVAVDIEYKIDVAEVEQISAKPEQESIPTTAQEDPAASEEESVIAAPTRGIDELKRAIQQQADSRINGDSDISSNHKTEPAEASAKDAAEKKDSAAAKRRREKKSQEPTSQETTAHKHNSQESSSRDSAQRTRSNTLQRTRQAYRMEPPGPVRHNRRPSRPEAYIPIALQSNLPQTFQDDIYCPTNILNELYNLAPENTNVMELLTHSWQLARSGGNLSGTRNKVNFPLALEYGCDRKHAPSIVAVIQKTLPITKQKPWIISKLIVQKTASATNATTAANKRRSPQAVLNEPLFCASDQLVEQNDIEHPFNGALQALTQFALLGSWHTIASELNDIYGGQGGSPNGSQNVTRSWIAQNACNYLASIFYRAYTTSPESLVQTSTKALLHTNLYTLFGEAIYMCFNHLEEPEDPTAEGATAANAASDTASEEANQPAANEDVLDACIVRNKPPRAETSSWSFAEFSTSDGNFVTQAMEDASAPALSLPKPVSFTFSPQALYFDANAELAIDTHQLRTMLPAEIQQNVSQDAFLDACQQAFAQAQKNYRNIAQGYSSALNESVPIVELAVPTATPYALVINYADANYQLVNVVERSVAQQSAFTLSPTPASWLAEKPVVTEIHAS